MTDTDKIREMVTACNMSLRTVAAAVGVNDRTLRHIVKGDIDPLPFVLTELTKFVNGEPTARQVEIMGDAIARGQDSGRPFSSLADEAGLDREAIRDYLKT